VRNLSALATVALTCTGLALAGCGGSSSTSAGGGYPATSTPSSTATAAAKYAPTGAAGAAAASKGSSAAAASGAAGTVVGTAHTSLGTILVAGAKRLTVYLFAADKGASSNCSSACAQVWPPVTTSGKPRAEGGAHSAKLSTIARAGGVKQVTYGGHPLYYYVGDSRSGMTTGQGIESFGAAWYVLDPQGRGVGAS
jgi:predicted lipoprotein with Yx(FWY)xxD motif